MSPGAGLDRSSAKARAEGGGIDGDLGCVEAESAQSPGRPAARERHPHHFRAGYAWLNPIQIWATGTVEFANGQLPVTAYAI
jgi:hypothetical protein